MATQACIVWDDGFSRYDFGEGHPMDPVRLDLTARLCNDLGLFEPGDVEILAPDPASDEVLARVHDVDYIAAVRAASVEPSRAQERFGIGTDDDPAFAGMHEASARIAAGSQVVAERVWTGQAQHGINFAGGLHHAMRERAAGFCVYNDAALAIDWLLSSGAQRVAYVDVDAHHGDGVERAFWNEPRVLTISLHETGTILFPGTGFAREIGGADALGSVANVALPPGTRDAPWLRAVHATVPAMLRAFRPEVLVTQHGADTHFSDPLAHLSISVDGQRMAMETMHDLAHELCQGKWIGLGGGGYEVVGVVPRSWAHLVAIAEHRPVSVETPLPAGWIDHVVSTYGAAVPETMGDGMSESGRIWWRPWENGYDPENSVDLAVMATREAVFPQMGLDVWFD